MSGSRGMEAVCIAKTRHGYHEGESGGASASDHELSKPHSGSFFREAQFSNDGTTIITNNGNQTLTSFVLPSDLLDETKQPHTFSAHNTIHSPSPIQSYAVYPRFSLDDPSTTVALSTSKDLPISLSNVIHQDAVHATYSLINATTEAYISPNSLLWTADGSRFIAGSENRISVFDSSADGSGPVMQHKTAPGRAEKRFPGRSSAQHCRGIVSALDLSVDHFLAAGTTQREVAIYEHEGMGGQAVTSFSLAPLPGEVDVAKGNGITQVKWTSDGTYLLIAERQSDCIQVWDLRHSLRRVGWLGGRRAKTTQRLGVELLSTPDGVEVWAGGTDGCVRMWENPGLVEGEQLCDGVLEAHGDSVSSTIWHPGGAVLATCSGRRPNYHSQHDQPSSPDSDTSEDEETPSPDDTLKIWTLPQPMDAT